MYSRIVVGHDHRAGGADALALAKVIADTTGASLVLAGVIPVGMAPGDVEVVWREEEHAYGEKVRSAAESADGEARVFHSHSVARGISDLAEEIDADLIVVGSSRRGKVGRILAGDIALQVLHGAHCSVAVAPIGYGDAPHALDSIVVGVDGAPEAHAAVVAAVELAGAARAQATLVSVMQPPRPVFGKGGGAMGIGELKAAMREQLEKELEHAASRFGPGAQPERELVEGDPAEALRHAAEGKSLLIVGSRGHGPLGRVLLGSTDAALLRSASTPLVVLPRRAKVVSGSENPTPAAAR